MPKILLVAGTHGNEHAAVAATTYVFNKLNGNNDLTFCLINMPGLAANTREYPNPPEATRDLNRSFSSENTIDWMEQDINSLKITINSADIVVDVHNSPACDNAILVSNNNYAIPYILFAKRHKLGYLLRESEANTIKKYAISRGKPGFTVELGGMGYGPEFDTVFKGQTEFLKNFVKSLLYLDCVDPFFSDDYRPLPQQYNMIPLYVHATGLVKYRTKLGMPVKAGDPILDVVSRVNEVLETVPAPCDCRLADCETNLWVTPGFNVCSVQPVIPDSVLVRTPHPAGTSGLIIET